MTTAEAVADLVASNSAILCLDTCDFIDVVRGVAEGFLTQAESFRRMQEQSATDPHSLRVVVTYLVRHEWEQNKGDAIKKVRGFLRDVTQTIDRVDQVRPLVGLPVSMWDDTIVEPLLSDALIGLAETILDHSVVLAK